MTIIIDDDDDDDDDIDSMLSECHRAMVLIQRLLILVLWSEGKIFFMDNSEFMEKV